MEKNILIIASTSELAQKTIEELKNSQNSNHYRIFATSRHCANLIDEKVTEFTLDIEREQDFIHLREKFQNIQFDTIINFAGIAVAGAVCELDELQLKKQFDVNVLGLLRVIKYFCPYLKNDGKLINVSSMASYGTFPFISPYCMSKASADILLNSFSIESGIKTVSIRPGAVATKFWETSIELNKKCLETNGFECEKEFMKENANHNSLHAKNPIYVAKKIAAIINKKNPKTVYNIGIDAKISKLSRFLPQGLINFIIKKALKIRLKNYGKQKQ